MKDNPGKWYIYFPMEKVERGNPKKIFYFGIEEGAVALADRRVSEKEAGKQGYGIGIKCRFMALRRLKKQGCPIRSLEKELLFSGGKIQVYYALLPEYAGKELFSKKGKPWKQKYLEAVVQSTIWQAENERNCREFIMTAKLDGGSSEVPIELWAAYLHTFVPFESVCVSFSEEGGTFEARQAVLLLSPYLKRMRRVVMLGEECPASEMFSDYLYYEYGLMIQREKQAPKDMVCLKFDEEEAAFGSFSRKLGNNLRISKAETMKFLDTVVKNGYNTES